MTCLVFEGTDRCVWCRDERDGHRYRWCRRCKGDLTLPDPTDREAQMAGRPSWQWRQHFCECRHGIVTIAGQPLTPDDVNVLNRARLGNFESPRYLPFDEPQRRTAHPVAETEPHMVED